MITLRKLKKKDAEQVSLLIPQLTQHIVDPEHLVKRIKKLANPQNGQFLVAESHGKIIGSAGLVWYAIPSKGLVAWVEELVVDRQSRGQGVGRALMEHLLQIALQKKVRRIKLTTHNPLAENLYKELGFIKKEDEYLYRDLS